MKVNQLLIVMAAVLLVACESKWEKMPDDILAVKYSDCLTNSNHGPAMAQTCANYERECMRRRKNGIYAC